jgi:hypothetical protein
MTLRDQILSNISNHSSTSKVMVPNEIFEQINSDMASWLPVGISVEIYDAWAISVLDSSGLVLGNYTIIAWP